MKVFCFILYFIFATLLTTALPFSGILMPLFFVLSSALFVAMSVKRGVIYSLFSAAFSGALIYFIFNTALSSVPAATVCAIVFPVVSLLSALGIYFALKLGSNVKTVLLAGTTGYIALIIAVYFVFGGTFIADVINIAKEFMFESLSSVAASIPVGSEDAVNEIKQMYELYFENLKVLAPSIILSLFFLLSYFTLKVSELFAKKDLIYSSVPSFSEIHALPVFLLIAVISYFAQLAENTFISGLMGNVFMAISIYYTLCGFSLFDFFLKLRIKSIGGRIGIFVAGLIVLSLVSAFFTFANPILIAMFFGMADSIFNYRLKIRLFHGK